MLLLRAVRKIDKILLMLNLKTKYDLCLRMPQIRKEDTVIR